MAVVEEEGMAVVEEGTAVEDTPVEGTAAEDMVDITRATVSAMGEGILAAIMAAAMCSSASAIGPGITRPTITLIRPRS